MQNNFEQGWRLIAGFRFIFALCIVLSVIAETLVNRTGKFSGAWLVIALYTMPTVSCCIIS